MAASFIDPTPRLRRSFLQAVREFVQDDEFPLPWFVSNIDAAALTDEGAFARYVDRVLSERLPRVPRVSGWVPMTTLWWVDNDEMLGRLAIRHELTPALERAGGHIGYDVRPGMRRRGHATAMLSAALPIAANLGIERALLTCDVTNVASQRVIDVNGGEHIDTIDDKFRYWVPTSR